jgi:hypothetical protein
MLLRSLASRIAVRKTAAERALKLLLKRFPHMYWDSSSYTLALAVYERAVWDAKAQLEQFQAHSQVASVIDAHSTQGDPSQRHAVLKTAESIARGWVELTVVQAPLITSHILLHFMDQDGSNMPFGCSYATNLIHEVLMSASSGGAPLVNAGGMRSKSAVRWRHWGCWAVHGGLDLTCLTKRMRKKAKYMGIAHHGLRPSKPGEACSVLRNAVKELKDHNQLSQNVMDSSAENTFADLLGVLAALVFLICKIGSRGDDEEKLDIAIMEAVHAVAHTPFQQFTFESMKEATSVWAWMHIACPSRIRRLLANNVCAAWSDSQDRGVGIFSKHKQHDTARHRGAHALCAEYLQELVRVTSSSADSAIPCIEICLHRTLAAPASLSVSSDTMDALIQVLRLSLAVASDESLPSCHAALLLDRLLCTGLMLFSDPPSWKHEHRHSFSGSRPGLTRQGGVWVVIPTWTGMMQPPLISQRHACLFMCAW